MTRYPHANDLLSRSSKLDCRRAGLSNWLARATLAAAASLALLALSPKPARADGDLRKLKHIIIVMMENHSFDNYLGTLPYVPSGPYHRGPCFPFDHRCVDGLSCTGTYGNLSCSNSNPDDSGGRVHSFHEPNYCLTSDLDHEWPDSHAEANFTSPNDALAASPNDGFVRMNDLSLYQPDLGVENATEDETMGYYTQTDLPFYYSLASTFAMDDRYFSSVLGPTFPNRSYLYAATSFGHVLALPDEIPFGTASGYQPITGTILDLLDANHVSWVNYFSDLPSSGSFRASFPSPHVKFITDFFADAATGNLPSVAFVDPAFGFGGIDIENDEHPPTDIRKGQDFVSHVVQAVNLSSSWKDTIIFIVWDENGGAYDHVAPPKASQGGLLSPDLTNPGLCEDLSNPPASLLPGGGANCAFSLLEAEALCPALAATAPFYPTACANFDQLGFRVPFIAASPFSKPHYVSHTVGDHTSILALIEKRFFSLDSDDEAERPHLTARDLHASTLEDMFDFNGSPSLGATITPAPAPDKSDPNCAPFFP